GAERGAPPKGVEMSAIVLGTDGSVSAERATREAIELAKALDLPLHTVVVWKPQFAAGVGFAAVSAVPELNKIARERAHEVADRTTAEALAAGLKATCEVREGDPADEICRAAAEHHAQTIVVGA